jgi:hypothetical protein
MLVLAFVAGVFALSQATDDDQLTLLSYGVAVVATVALVFDLAGQFNAGTPLVVGGLLVLASAFFGLRTRLDEGSRFVSGARGKQLFAAVAVLAVAVLAVDVVTGSLAYELQPRSQVELAGDREPDARLGAVVVSNPGPFPERVDIPRYEVCAAGDWSAFRPETPEGETRPVNAHLRVQHGYGDHVFGFGEKRYAAVVQVHGDGVAGEEFLVERTDRCPADESGDPYIAVFERDENERYSYGTPA